MSLLLSIVAGVTLSVPAPSALDSLQSHWVAADARWLAHVDVERILDSTLLKQLHAMAEEEGGLSLDGWNDSMQEIENELGFNPLTDVKSVTVYSRGQSPEEAVALIEVNRPGRFLQAMEKGPGHTVRPRDGYSIHSWGAAEGHQYGFGKELHQDWCATLVEIENSDRGLLIASETSERLTDAMDVLIGKRANMTDAEAAVLSVRPRSSAWFVAAAKGLDGLGDLPGSSRFSKGARDLLLEMGDHEGELYLSMEVETENAATATSLVQLAQGGLALLRLGAAGDSDPDLQKLLALTNGLQIQNKGAHLSVRLECSEKELMSHLQEAAGHESTARRDSDGAHARAKKDSDSEDDEGHEMRVEVRAKKKGLDL